MAAEDPERDIEVSRPVVGSTKIRPEILRGVRLSKTPFRLGLLWRKSPSHLPSQTRTHLWSLSETCESIDIFLSHSWAAPGWQKYLALLVHFHSGSIAYSIVHLLVMGLVLDMAHLTPGGCPRQSSPFNIWEDDVAFNPWIGSLVPIVGFVSLFLSPCVREDGGPLVFYDAVCINQFDDAVKGRGINSLAGFLAKSKELYILWTPEWYTRLWCVMELSTYGAIGSENDITFCPVFATCMTFLCYVITTGFILVWSFLVCTHESMEQLVSWTSTVVLLAIYARMLRQRIALMARLDWFMANFESKHAKCSDGDREFLMQTIRHWHGSEENFNNYVRGTVRERESYAFDAGRRRSLLLCAADRNSYWLLDASPQDNYKLLYVQASHGTRRCRLV